MDSGLFNENSRKVNDHDVDETIYTKTNPPKSHELDGFKIYKAGNTLNIIGLEKGEETIESIVNALPTWSILFVRIDSKFNLDIYPELYREYNNIESAILKVTKISATNVLFEFYFNSSDSSLKPMSWTGMYNGTWSGWVETSHKASYLPLDGSVPMAGNLVIEKHVASVILKQGEETGTAGVVIRHNPGNGLEMGIANDTSSFQKNTRFLQLQGIASGTTLAEALTLVEYIEGQSGGVAHYIYGSHNTDMLKNKLLALQFATKNDISNFATKTEVSNAITTAIGDAIAASY